MIVNSYFEIFFIFILLLLPFIYEACYSFRYYMKFFVYYCGIMFNSTILMPVFALNPCNVKNLLIASKFCRHISTVLGLKWSLRGREYLEKQQACVIVANHQSSLDILGMFELWPIMNKCTVVAKRELFWFWPFGLSAWLCGLIFIDRYHAEKAKNTINQSVDYLKDEKVKLWVFPEGTRRNTGQIHDFKKGAFRVAIQSQMPILPVVFSSYSTFLDDKNKIMTNGNVIMSVLPEISTENMTLANLEELMEYTRQVMLEKYNETSKEIQLTAKPHLGLGMMANNKVDSIKKKISLVRST